MAEATRNQFKEYFKNAPANTKNMHDMKIMGNDPETVIKILADSQVNHKDRIINYLYDSCR